VAHGLPSAAHAAQGCQRNNLLTPALCFGTEAHQASPRGRPHTGPAFRRLVVPAYTSGRDRSRNEHAYGKTTRRVTVLTSEAA